MWIAPWEEAPINLIGPWKVKVNGWQVEFNELTCIDTASNLVKLNRFDNKTAKHISDKFTQSWLCWYPCLVGPRGTIHVNHLQAPCGAFLRWDLSWHELVNVTNSYVDSTRFWISTVCSCGLRYGSTSELQNDLLGLMVLDSWWLFFWNVGNPLEFFPH